MWDGSSVRQSTRLLTARLRVRSPGIPSRGRASRRPATAAVSKTAERDERLGSSILPSSASLLWAHSPTGRAADSQSVGPPEELCRRIRRSLAEDFANGVIPWGPDTTVTREVAVAAVTELQAAVDRARRPGRPTPRDLQTRIPPILTSDHRHLRWCMAGRRWEAVAMHWYTDVLVHPANGGLAMRGRPGSGGTRNTPRAADRRRVVL
jgi:hypothetical protein